MTPEKAALWGVEAGGLAEAGKTEWFRIRRENLCDGALFPSPLQKDFAKVVQKVLLLDSLSNSEKMLDYDLLERFRSDCVGYIQKEF